MRLSPLALAFTALSALTPLVPSSADAQASWRDHVESSRLREATDSFTVFVRGNPVGWQRLSWAREDGPARDGRVLGEWPRASGTGGAPTWIMADEVVLTGVKQRSEVRFTSTLLEQGLRQWGKAGSTEMRITLDRQQDRMRGSALTPGGGTTAVPMDVTVTDDVIDDNALTMILPAIRWAEGVTLTLPVLSSGKGTIAPFTATVTGRGATTVPAGTFETWRITLDGGQYAVLAEVTTTAPYRVVRLSPRGSPMDIQLAQ
jgi:hypothetical protein